MSSGGSGDESSESTSVAASLMVHLHPGVPVHVRLYPDEDRAVVVLGGPVAPTTLHLFVRRAELVALRDALTAAVVDLDTAQHATDTAGGVSGPLGEVDTPAA